MKNTQNRIIELPENVRSKIAAGEVIEGPFSCVKELVENSIDAGASRITIDIEEGGKRLIRVSDNGSGIHPEDLPLVINRYTTSKLKTEEGLESISSMGFRGEALAAIASVSQLEILTKTEENQIGRYIKAEGGNIKDRKEKQRQKGTSVIVKYLFRNFPARRKFLKSSGSEFRKILSEIIPVTISFPEISFVITHNGKEVINVNSGSREERLMSVLDESLLNSLIPFEYKGRNSIKIYGWLQKPNLPSQKKYYLFLNRRKIWDGKVFRLIRDFYSPFSNENPSFVIFMEVPPHELDINVHPAKKEVRFHNERQILGEIYNALEYTFGKESDYREELFSFETDYLFDGESKTKFWQLHDSYIVAQTRSGMVIIDQHAAHERILYDNIKNNASFPTQSLLFPLQIKHTPLEMSKLNQIKGNLRDIGFRFKILSDNTVIWEGIPSIAENINEESIKSILEDIARNSETEIHDIMKSISCHMAIKEGDPLQPEEMEHLVNMLFATDTPFRCPHGRPIIYEISLKELENKFQR